MKHIVECVPNVSEGRNRHVLESLKAVVSRVPGVSLLDHHMDSDHHRSVLTFAGEPEAVAEAAFEVVRLGSTVINLIDHVGEHPRIGAVDVLPFIPIRGMHMAQCVELAKWVGARIGADLNIPVFLYEEACSIAERRRLEDVRRGGLKGLASRMATQVQWKPDFGPGALHPTAGGIAVGARQVLIAYNVTLDIDDVAVAKAIAKKIRASNGGLPSLKALGIALQRRRLVQVSMNLVNFHETSITAAFEAVKREADRLGVTIVSSEFVGLVPQEALLHTAGLSLKCHELTITQVLETQLAMKQAEAPDVQDPHIEENCHE
ncbi:MAG: glutamate formimidoyltransferase [Nitrospirales bacterium]|nr:glutamate formimidoyltransferase [Nitrospirales bacterium]